ncbi:lytic murein transglycosylase [Sphingomicrobium nitratireducens]|uniref:lytic murein transglycosylase n=1 Tax=Sphingomicrobium nitratireducens TaxID=2964666 RepID=UPI00223EB44C|nr:lytic murein transglycosylase [Sphingomicrobium nitratireducens]
MVGKVGLTIAVAAILGASPACAQEADPLAPLDNSDSTRAAIAPGAMTFEGYKRELVAKARAAGISEATVAVIPGLRLNQRSIDLDRSQPGGGPGTGTPAYAPYRARHVTTDIVNRGIREKADHAYTLSALERSTGVDPHVILAIYGKETSYGAVTGNFDLLEALSTLAWEGRRRELFEGEFMAALKLMDRGYTRRHLKGSYAGAAGKVQFMPSNILRLARDGDGDGFADIWNSEPDAFASIANYLVDAGWQPDVPWGIAVNVPARLDRASIASPLVPPRCEAVFKRHSRWLPMSEWRRLGVTPQGRSLSDDTLATLIEPDGPGRTAYLTTQNYRAILDYNCSNFYALTIGLVADGIARR